MMRFKTIIPELLILIHFVAWTGMPPLAHGWESEPGKVHALSRTGSGKVWRTDSVDGGLTWSEYEVTDLPNNNSGLDALRLADGRQAGSIQDAAGARLSV